MASKIAVVLFIVMVCTNGASAGNDSEGVPALQVTSPNGAVSTLLGTMHVGYPGLRQPAPTLLDKARALVIEHEMEDADRYTELAPEALATALSTGKMGRANWAKGLDDRKLERARKNLNCSQKEPISEEQFFSLLAARAPRLMAAIVFLPCTTLPGRDTLLIDAARSRGVAIVELETQQEIAIRRRAIPDGIYVQQLNYGLTTDLDALYRGLVRALNQGDYDAISAAVAASYQSPGDAALSHRILVRERNAAWMTRLTAELSAGNAVVAVGAAHLPGPDGIIALLSKAGYLVKPISVPSQTTP